jgi:glucuronoarabinoxylan endo-1,4-beta-xylanase
VTSPRLNRIAVASVLASTPAAWPFLISTVLVGCGGGSTTPVDVTPALPTAVTVTVDLTTTYQTMVGFGAAVAYYAGSATTNPMSAQLYQTIFSDLGLQVLRIANWYQNNGNDGGAALNQTAAFVKGAHQMGYTPLILMSSWNPPYTSWTSADGSTSYASLKSNDKNDAGGTLPLTAAGGYDYPDFGTWWAESLKAYAAAGVVPDYISIQNEPDFNTTNEGTCLFDPSEDTMNAGYPPALHAVKTAIASSGLAMPKLVGPEPDGIADGRLASYMNGIEAAGFAGDLDVVGHHLYNGGTDAIPNTFDTNLSAAAAAADGKPLWMTEYAPNDPDMFTTAWLIQNSVTVEGVSTYLYWDLYWPAAPAGAPPEGLVSLTATGFTINDSYYAVQHFAKGIATGWTRVAATSTETVVTASAFLSPDGTQLTLVLLNTDGTDHQVTIDPGTFAGTTSTVYRTSGAAERYNLVGPLDAASSFDMPSLSIATVMLTP